MNALARVVAATAPELRRMALTDVGPGRFESAAVDAERKFVLEAVLEGYLMHYREPRAFAAEDADLRLLAGDALYAAGLRRLAETGDLYGVAELAELITLCARAHAEGHEDVVDELWSASVRALEDGGGAAGPDGRAGTLARRGSPR